MSKKVIIVNKNKYSYNLLSNLDINFNYEEILSNTLITNKVIDLTLSSTIMRISYKEQVLRF